MSNEKLSWFDKIIDSVDLVGKVADHIIDAADGEIQKVKKKVITYLIIYGGLALAFVFIIIGTLKQLALMYSWSEGLAQIIFGCIIIVLLSLYSLITKV